MKVRILLIALSFLAPALLMAATPMTTVSVTVKNHHDKPVDNAAVIIDFLGSRQVSKLGRRRLTHWEVHTNQEGLAHFPPVPQGTLQIQVIAKSYQTFGKKFDVSDEEKTIDVKLNPPQEQYSAHPPLKPADPPK